MRSQGLKQLYDNRNHDYYLSLLSFILQVHYLQSEITYFCDVMIVFNIIANFFTGYIEGLSHKVAVLSMEKIALRYLKTWLIVDLLACMGVLFEIHYKEHITVILIMESIKIIRIPIILIYLENILTVMRASVSTYVL